LRQGDGRPSTSMNIESTDRDLLSRLTADPGAFEEFYRRHVDRIVRFAARRVRNPADVADVVANTFLAVVTSAESYDPDRGEPTAWLIGVAARLIANDARRSARQFAVASRIAGHRLLDAGDIERLEEQIFADQDALQVLDVIDRLKPRAREVLLLVGVEGLTPTDGSRVLGISAANFRMRLSAARRALARALLAAGRDMPVGSAQSRVSFVPCSRTPTSTLKEVTI
jgi:RNA polymerase sigma factor (sigma-70 family)